MKYPVKDGPKCCSNKHQCVSVLSSNFVHFRRLKIDLEKGWGLTSINYEVKEEVAPAQGKRAISCCIFGKYLPGLPWVLIKSMSHEQWNDYLK